MEIPDPPDQVTGLTVSTKDSGNALRWNQSQRATSYVVYRADGVSPTFSGAIAIATLSRADNVSYFDVAGQGTAGTKRTYWVQARNGYAEGLVSTPVSTTDTGVSGTIITGLIRDVNSKFVIDLNNALLTVTDNQGAPVTRVKLGKVGGATTDYGLEIYDSAGRKLVGLTEVSAVASGSSACRVGVNSDASGSNSVAIGNTAVVTANSGVALGQNTSVTAINSIAIGAGASSVGSESISIGRNASTTQADCVAIGDSVAVTGASGIGIGQAALAFSIGTIALGASATVVNNSAGADYSIAIGNAAVIDSFQYAIALGKAATVGADNAVAIGRSTNSAHARSLALGYQTTTTKIDQLSANVDEVRWTNGANGQEFYGLRTKSELLTINAAASTDTSINIPANVHVKAVTVRTTVTIPTAATYTVTGATSGTAFHTAAVSAAANSTDKGNAAGVYYNATSQLVRITPNAVPANNNGRVRVTIVYEDVTPPTS